MDALPNFFTNSSGFAFPGHATHHVNDTLHLRKPGGDETRYHEGAPGRGRSPIWSASTGRP
jgi:hypothetical protein